MEDGNNEQDFPRETYWTVQPRWAKVVTILVGFPAWVGLMLSIFEDSFSWVPENLLVGVFTMVALMQLCFAVRGYWRMDL